MKLFSGQSKDRMHGLLSETFHLTYQNMVMHIGKCVSLDFYVNEIVMSRCNMVLGIMFDDGLIFSNHVDDVAKNIKSHIYDFLLMLLLRCANLDTTL